jgi:hypothetical protein
MIPTGPSGTTATSLLRHYRRFCRVSSGPPATIARSPKPRTGRRNVRPIEGVVAPGLTTVMLYNSAESGHLFPTVPGTARSGAVRTGPVRSPKLRCSWPPSAARGDGRGRPGRGHPNWTWRGGASRGGGQHPQPTALRVSGPEVLQGGPPGKREPGGGVVLVLQNPRGDVRGGAHGSCGELAVHDPIYRAGATCLIEIQLEAVGEVASTAHVLQPGPLSGRPRKFVDGPGQVRRPGRCQQSAARAVVSEASKSPTRRRPLWRLGRPATPVSAAGQPPNALSKHPTSSIRGRRTS